MKSIRVGYYPEQGDKDYANDRFFKIFHKVYRYIPEKSGSFMDD